MKAPKDVWFGYFYGTVGREPRYYTSKRGAPRDMKLTKMVPYDAAKEAVVRAAVQLVKDRFETDGDNLYFAVERLERKRGRR